MAKHVRIHRQLNVTLAFLVVGMTVLGCESGHRDKSIVNDHPNRVLTQSRTFQDGALTSAEREVLQHIPRAYRVGDSVAVTGMARRFRGRPAREGDVAGKIVQIPIDYRRADGQDPNTPDPNGSYIQTDEFSPAYRRDFLFCLRQPDVEGKCLLVVAKRDQNGTYWPYLGYGSGHFRSKTGGMEIFISSTFVGDRPGIRILGATYGTDTATVELTLADGSTVDAEVHQDVAPHDSLWVGTASSPLEKVTTYDVKGGVLEVHKIQHCNSGVDCEIR